MSDFLSCRIFNNQYAYFYIHTFRS